MQHEFNVLPILQLSLELSGNSTNSRFDGRDFSCNLQNDILLSKYCAIVKYETNYIINVKQWLSLMIRTLNIETVHNYVKGMNLGLFQSCLKSLLLKD